MIPHSELGNLKNSVLHKRNGDENRSPDKKKNKAQNGPLTPNREPLSLLLIGTGSPSLKTYENIISSTTKTFKQFYSDINNPFIDLKEKINILAAFVKLYQDCANLDESEPFLYSAMRWIMASLKPSIDSELLIQLLKSQSKLMSTEEGVNVFLSCDGLSVNGRLLIVENSDLRLLILSTFLDILPQMNIQYMEQILSDTDCLINSADQVILNRIIMIRDYVELKTSPVSMCENFPIELPDVRLGSGGFGYILKAVDKLNRRNVAVKKMKKAFWPNYNFTSLFLNEMKVHAKVNHKNIIRCYAICLDPDDLKIVMELAVYGSLHDYLHSKNGAQSSQLAFNYLQFALDIACGLNYLHDISIMHGDLKTSNIFLTDNGLKIGDFGCAQELSSKRSRQSEIGTVMFLPPEMFNDPQNACSPKRDIYAFAYVLWELQFQKKPFGQLVDAYAPNPLHILMGARESLPEGDYPLSSLISRCWQERAEQRPEARVIVRELSNLTSLKV